MTGDTKDGTVDNIAALKHQRIRTDFPLSEVGEHNFIDDAAADRYRCPGGQTLGFLSHCQSTQRRIY